MESALDLGRCVVLGHHARRGDDARDTFGFRGQQRKAPADGDAEERDAAAANVPAPAHRGDDGLGSGKRGRGQRPPAHTGHIGNRDEIAGTRE